MDVVKEEHKQEYYDTVKWSRVGIAVGSVLLVLSCVLYYATKGKKEEANEGEQGAA